MMRLPGMPMLPGAQFYDRGKRRHPRQQTLMHYQGIQMLSDRREPELVEPNGIVADPKCPPVPAQLNSLWAPKATTKLPPWLAYDKQVLCFTAYFKENLTEIYHAPYQVRKVKIYFYLEDGTMQVTEPKVENSGIPQGCLVHRQRIPKAPPTDREFISIFDLNVDTDVQIFDRVYHISGCDIFTRQFLNRAGIFVPEAQQEPCDPTTEIRKRSALKQTANSCSSAIPKKHTFAQFLEFDRRVLKFQGYWNDRSEFGDVRKLEICYYLADDTIDIKEKFPRNSGREGPSTFLKRGKLPKEFSGLPLPGQQTAMTLLNVLGNSMRDVRYVADPLNTGQREVQNYTDQDLQIGAVLNVFGRAVVLTGCDQFTQSYYREKYGIQEFCAQPIPERSDIRPYTQGSIQSRRLPPYNGWGSHEDSEGNCITVEPKPPQADFKKLFKYDGCILRFGAKLVSAIRDNGERDFVISYFLADDTVQIYESSRRNSGFLGGEFLKKARVPLPGQDMFSSSRPEYYRANDFYIGRTMTLKDHIFHIVSADEFTLMYMEQHPSEFPVADIRLIMQKIREAVRPEYKQFVLSCKPDGDLGDYTTVSFDTLRSTLLSYLSKDCLLNHEIVTVCRFFSAEQAMPPSCDRNRVRAAAQLELKRALWNGVDQLHDHLSHINPACRPYISEAQVRSTLRGCRLPFSLELVEDILMVLQRNGQNEIEVRDFLAFFNMRSDQVPDIAPLNIAFELCPKLPFLHKGRLVDFTWFLDYLGLEEELKRANI
ncbi:EF-hand domain-containing family member C2 isoform X1 [Drosophila eugracilis]|uniref:EF-hand domain-containing family member C2 isoform X1 n=1 Tax=Drosophila eugracilis TaxID=29029 RepID=UPI0007E89079|nr:EF-hand domain-containing family member C2 isoform X1 [Drosophila eugracilis]